MAKGIFNDILEFERHLALPSGFYQKILVEDDWSFVVKLSALFEAASTHILIKRLDTPELADSFAELDYANSKFGRVTLLRKLGAITNEQSKFLLDLATLRNKLVHNIASVGFSFEKYIDSLDKQQQSAVVKSFGHGINDDVEVGDKTVSRRDFVLKNTRLALWLTAAEILACLYLEIEDAQLRLRRLVLDGYAKMSHSFAQP
jgi:hypothetical protein